MGRKRKARDPLSFDALCERREVDAVCAHFQQHGTLPTEGPLVGHVNKWHNEELPPDLLEPALQSCPEVVPHLGGGPWDLRLAARACSSHARQSKLPENADARAAEERWRRGGTPPPVRTFLLWERFEVLLVLGETLSLAEEAHVVCDYFIAHGGLPRRNRQDRTQPSRILGIVDRWRAQGLPDACRKIIEEKCDTLLDEVLDEVSRLIRYYPRKGLPPHNHELSSLVRDLRRAMPPDTARRLRSECGKLFKALRSKAARLAAPTTSEEQAASGEEDGPRTPAKAWCSAVPGELRRFSWIPYALPPLPCRLCGENFAAQQGE